MSQQELLTKVLTVLDRLSIAYFVTGSWASSLQGEPRATHDLDLVVSLQTSHVPELLAAFPDTDYYLSDLSVDEAIRNQSMFNLLDNASGDKVDFWMLTDTPWDRSRFERRQSQPLFGREVYLCTAEDTILAKLNWAKLSGGSEKQFTDALRVYEVQFGDLDRGYLDRWATSLGIADLWRRLQQEAEVTE